MEWRIALPAPLDVVLQVAAGIVTVFVIYYGIGLLGRCLACVAKYARKPLRRCVKMALNAVAHVVGAVAVAVCYPLVAIATAIKAGEKEEGGWMFRVLFGGGVALAILGAILTLLAVRR
ncbi:MAG: hypothetical protein HYV25_00170 [Candidatus Harrisonbacteria bacterium]|nr:hypothetical protein [Candidatus Harrisonbacteria bacterium]